MDSDADLLGLDNIYYFFILRCNLGFVIRFKDENTGSVIYSESLKLGKIRS